MKTLLIGINAKFIHSNLAIRYLYSYYNKQTNQKNDDLKIMEFNINQQLDYIVSNITVEEPEIIGFSCYLWNIEMVRKISSTLKKIFPKLIIILGGPEVSYTGEKELEKYSYLDYIISGEGEEVFYNLREYLIGNKDFESKGIIYRKDKQVLKGEINKGMNMDDIPFIYDEELTGLDNKIIYYETMRGCPFKCQYCLSSIEKGVRFRSFNLVKNEIDFFLRHNLKQVKLVDRTFNVSKKHAHEIMEHVILNDNGITNWHFEVAPELIDDDFLNTLSKGREGLFQLEIGVQSTNEETLKAIRRNNDLEKIEDVVKKIKALKNTHVHLDLIAGLPLENYETFGKSFDYVYSLKPNMLQLGFLKVLKGAGLYIDSEKYGIVYRDYAPYEVLKTNNIDYNDIVRLKKLEDVLETFGNSGQFAITEQILVGKFETPFKAYEYLAKNWDLGKAYSKLELYQYMLDESEKYLEKELLIETLSLDYCFREKPKKKLEWMMYNFVDGSTTRFVLDALNEKNIWKDEFEKYNTKQLSRMFHIDELNLNTIDLDEMVKYKIEIKSEKYKGKYLVVNYNRRDFITNNGEMVLLTIK